MGTGGREEESKGHQKNESESISVMIGRGENGGEREKMQKLGTAAGALGGRTRRKREETEQLGPRSRTFRVRAVGT